MKIHNAHSQPIKTGKFGPKMDSMAMQNNPFRAAYQDGHANNESYKNPVPNASGSNPSYMHPHQGPSVSKGNKTPAGPIQHGKNKA